MDNSPVKSSENIKFTPLFSAVHVTAAWEPERRGLLSELRSPLVSATHAQLGFLKETAKTVTT